MEEALFLARALHYAAVVALEGALCFRLAVAPPFAGCMGTGAAPLARALAVTEWGALVLAVVSGAAWLVCTAAAILDLPLAAAAAPTALWPVLTATQFGRTTMARAGLAAGLALCLAWRGPGLGPGEPRTADWLAAVLGALLAAAIGFAGHAGATPGAVGMALLVSDMAHLIAAAAWVGGLLPLALLFALALRRGGEAWRGAAAATTRRFSALGIAAVAVVVASGTLNGWVLAGSLSALWASDYGRLLVVKVALVAAMVAIAAVNRFMLSPRLGEPETLRQLHRNTVAEAALGLIVIVIVAVLGTMPPPAHMQAMQGGM